MVQTLLKSPREAAWGVKGRAARVFRIIELVGMEVFVYRDTRSPKVTMMAVGRGHAFLASIEREGSAELYRCAKLLARRVGVRLDQPGKFRKGRRLPREKPPVLRYPLFGRPVLPPPRLSPVEILRLFAGRDDPIRRVSDDDCQLERREVMGEFGQASPDYDTDQRVPDDFYV